MQNEAAIVSDVDVCLCFEWQKIEEMPNDRMRIKVLDCCVTNRYDKRNSREYVNYVIFDFETVSWKGGGGQCTDSTTQTRCS